MNLAARIGSLAAVGIAGFIGPKVSSAVWKRVTGEEPPEDDGNVQLARTLAFAALSAVVLTTVQHYANRGANHILGISPKQNETDHSA